MTISTIDGLVAGLTGSGAQRQQFSRVAPASAIAGGMVSYWALDGFPGKAGTPPTGAGEAPTNATSGALPLTNPASGLNYLAALEAAIAGTGAVLLYDRLVHTSGLSGTVTSGQAVGTAALTRPDAAGVGAELFLECYAALGATPQTVTVTYTNSSGTGSRSGSASIPANWPASGLLPVSLAAGDVGVKSVETVTLAGSTGTAGNFGVTIARSLGEVFIPVANSGDNADPFRLGLPQIYSNAALWLMARMISGAFALEGCYRVANG